MATAKQARSKFSTPEGEIDYSDKVKGDRGNFDQSVKFDKQDGYIGITQYEGDSVRDRVLLSPKQFEALRRFAKAKQ